MQNIYLTNCQNVNEISFSNLPSQCYKQTYPKQKIIQKGNQAKNKAMNY